MRPLVASGEKTPQHKLCLIHFKSLISADYKVAVSGGWWFVCERTDQR